MTKLTINTEGEQSIIVTRRFAAPPADVYRAHVDSDLIQKWMLALLYSMIVVEPPGLSTRLISLIASSISLIKSRTPHE